MSKKKDLEHQLALAISARDDVGRAFLTLNKGKDISVYVRNVNTGSVSVHGILNWDTLKDDLLQIEKKLNEKCKMLRNEIERQ